MTVHSAPNVLSVHLKRFNGFGGKVERQVAFGERLALGRFLSSDNPERLAEANGGPHYSLVALLVHEGASVNSGHYFACVRDGASAGERRLVPFQEGASGSVPSGGGMRDAKCEDLIAFLPREAFPVRCIKAR
jgi:Ubiquitin carboxyl-terminal hydrolase